MNRYICGLCLGARAGARHVCYTATRCACLGPHITRDASDEATPSE